MAPRRNARSRINPGSRASQHRRAHRAKVLARAGLCSRRDAERWIADGRVSVDGAVLTSPAIDRHRRRTISASTASRCPQPERARLWRYHKPAGLVTTHRDEKGRPTVFDALPKELPRLISIGRLDLNSEGLLLLTNDGALARRLELPATGWLRRYKVRVHGLVDAGAARRAREGHHHRRRRLWPDPRQPRTPAGQQRLDRDGAARGQEPRGAPGARASRLSGDPADPPRPMGRSSSAIWRAARSRRCRGRCSPSSLGSGGGPANRGRRAMRIVGGRHRGRRLVAPPGETVRPTSDRAREALFNILSHGDFAADGVAFRRSSGARRLCRHRRPRPRGAVARRRAQPCSSRHDRDALARVAPQHRGARRGRREPISSPATRRGRRARLSPCAVAFLDPPYRSGLAEPALTALAAAGWLAPDALAVVEVAAREPFSPRRRVSRCSTSAFTVRHG